MKKVLKYAVAAWLILSVATAPFYWPYVRMLWVFNPKVDAPRYETPVDAAEARRQDLDYLATLLNYDRAFDEDARAAFTAALDAAAAQVDTLTDAQFYLALAEAVALADNGHTNISYHPQYTRFNTIGARLSWFEDGLFVVSAETGKADAVGRRVLSLDGVPVDEVKARLRRYRGGNEAWRDLVGTLIMESPDLLAAAGVARSADAITLELETGAGESDLVAFEGALPETPDDIPYRRGWKALVPGAATPGGEAWTHVLEISGAAPARYLTETDGALSYPLDGGGLYVRALPGFAVGDRAIKRVYSDILADHPDGGLDYLVVDFRLHDGGDYTKSMSFAKAAPRAVKDDGALYIITGPNTFSAAIVTAAMLKYYGGDRAMIVGEHMGDRERFWAETGSSFQLPNSGYYINYATGLHDWAEGCKGERHCFTLNEMHEVPAGDLTPATAVPLDFNSYRNGEDVVLSWIEAREAE